MNRKWKQWISGIILACMLAVAMPVGLLVSQAASASITFSDPSGSVGSEVTVNMKITTADGSLGSADIMLAYDASALEFVSGNSVEGGAGALRAHGGPDANDLTNVVFSMKFKALKASTTKVTISSEEVYDNNSQTVTISHQGNATVTIGGEGTTAASGDAVLTSLTVTPGTLSPEFSSSVDSYSVQVGTDVDALTVDAQSAAGAVVNVTGSEGLQMGENTVTIKVTAPDGVTIKNYTISVTKMEGGETAAAAEESGVSLEAAAKAITILAPSADAVLPEGFSETTIDIDGNKVTGWIWTTDEDHQYCVFYARNAAGEKNFYRYDLTEKTIQRYFADPAVDTGVSQEEYKSMAQDYNSLLQDYKVRMYVIIALIAAAVILLILVITMLISRGSRAETENFEADSSARSKRNAGRKKISSEERYLRGQEEEPAEEYYDEEEPGADRLPASEGRKAARKQAAPAAETATSVPVETPKQEAPKEAPAPKQEVKEAPASRQEAPKVQPAPQPATDTEDDDFEFIDID